MGLDTGELLQITASLLAVVILITAANTAPLKIAVGILMVMIPFQIVDTKFGSSSIAMTYALAGALVISGRLSYAPKLPYVIAVILAYLISISQLPRSLYVLHGVEIIALVSGFLVFFLAYNLARQQGTTRFIVNALLLANLLCIVYCLIQFSVGPGERLEFFGMRELRMNTNRGDGDARLVGPFGTPGITAAYFSAMTLILAFEATFSAGRRKALCIGTIVANVALMIATANRGSFFLTILGFLAFLFLFRRKLGAGKVIIALASASMMMLATAAFIVAYTDFGRMVERLAETPETSAGLPATRTLVWTIALENIQEKPIVGHGPRTLTQMELRSRSVPPEQLVAPYPHNLYLHLMVTVGLIGTVCMLGFLFAIAWAVIQGARKGHFDDEYERGWVIIGAIVICMFFLDELKIEFLRANTVDYAHFVFAIFGVFLARADIARLAAVENARPALSPVPTD